MGYDLHIHRAESWLDASATPITLDESARYIAESPDFRMDNFAEAHTSDGEYLRIESEGLAVWTAYPSSETAWFYHGDGEIVVKNPELFIRRKMFEVAAALSARVQGDEDELYGPDGEQID